MTRVAVLKGGRSLERQVSLASGARVEDALERLGHDVVAIDVGTDLLMRLRDDAPEVAFIALHGPGGEDGTVQELLEVLGIPYSGSGVAACARCADKVLAKHALRDAGLPTPDWVAFSETSFRELGAGELLGAIEQRLEFPLVVKPASQGSALGIKFAQAPSDVPAALVAAFSYDHKVLLERYVHGRDLAVGVLSSEGGGANALPIVEAVPRGERYDFAARYDIGRTAFECPARLEPAATDRAMEVALAAYELLGCYGFARVDMMLAEGGEPQILEINTIPGLTETSLLPQAADAAGIDFDELVGRTLELAIVHPASAHAPRPGSVHAPIRRAAHAPPGPPN
jgi:D-alanine-D-alanine ligase